MTFNEIKKITLTNNEEIAYRESGNGNKIAVLIHGNMSSSIHFNTLVKKLEHEYKIYAPDLRGFGHSSYKSEFNSLADLANDIKLFTDALNISEFTLLGWSTGGGVAMYYAANYPDDVSKLILLESVDIKGYPMFKKDENGNPILSERLSTKEEISIDPVQVVPALIAHQNKDKAYFKYLFDLLIYNIEKPSNEDYEKYLDEIIMQRNLVDIDYSLVNFNISNEHNGVVQGSNEIDKIKCPVIIVQGDKDLVVPMDMALSIKNGFNDKAELIVLENCGHCPMTSHLNDIISLFF